MNLTVFVIGLDVDLVEHNCGPGRLRGGLARWPALKHGWNNSPLQQRGEYNQRLQQLEGV
jgi:hypothetical protein